MSEVTISISNCSPSGSSELKLGRFHPKIICFGDSNTQRGYEENGWCRILSELWVRKCDIVNRGFSGYTTRMSKHILNNLLSYDNNPSGIILGAVVLLGSNDASDPVVDRRGVPLPEFKENLKFILNTLFQHGLNKENVILVSPPPLFKSKWDEFCKERGYTQGYTNERAKLYADECELISKELVLKNINLWKLMQQEKDWSKYLIDGLHFSAEGHKFFADAVAKEFASLIDSLPTVYPLWPDINPENPEPCLR